MRDFLSLMGECMCLGKKCFMYSSIGSSLDTPMDNVTPSLMMII